jgi:hypothetical protein
MDEDAKRPKAVSLCGAFPAMKKELKEMDGSIGRERTFWVSSEEKLVVKSRGATAG